MIKKRITPKLVVKEAVVLAAIFLLAYFGNQQLQTWLGQRALDKTNYQHISFSSALDMAQIENKQVLVDFAAIWCSGCRKMDNAVFSQPNVKEAIDAKYVFTRLEYDSNDRTIFERYGVEGFPTLLILNANGDVIRRVPTTLDPEHFISML